MGRGGKEDKVNRVRGIELLVVSVDEGTYGSANEIKTT